MNTIIYNKNKHLNNLKQRRQLWLKVHLWLGLILGFIFAIIGLTGSILVFYFEIDGLIYPNLYHLAENTNTNLPINYSLIAETVQNALPKNAKFTWISFPDVARSLNNLIVSYELPSPTIANEVDNWQVFINPYTAEVLGHRLWYSASYFSGDMGFIPLMFKLHYALLMKSYGVAIVGYLSVLFLVSTLTGLIVWYPLTHKWLQALTFKLNASKERFNFDLHKTIGFYSAIVLIAVLISGFSMNLPEQFTILVNIFSKLTASEDMPSKTKINPQLTWGEAVDVVQQNYPEGNLVWLVLNNDEYSIAKTGINSLNRFVGKRRIFVNANSGKITKMLDVNNGTAGDVFEQWQWPLHSGTAFGWTGRILVFLSGLACPILFVTGIIRWLQKRKVKQKQHRKFVNTR